VSTIAGRIAGAGLVVAAVAIVVLAALLQEDMSRETSLSREIQALQEVRGGLESLKDSLHRMRHATLARVRAAEVERERIAVDAELEYLRAKAAERPDVAHALAALEAPVRDYVDHASVVLRTPPSGPDPSPAFEESAERAFRSIQRATSRVSEEITRRTNAQIQSWASRETLVRALVAGAIALLIGLGIAFRQSLKQARRDAERIEQLAHYDSLTGLANRSLLGDRLDLMVAMAHRNAAPMAILLFDLDGLKGVNDALGHAAGDALLVAVGQRARKCVRASDTVGRLGGDEFLVLLPDTDRDGARSVAGKLLEALSQPFDIGPKGVRVSASIGGSFLPGPSRDAEALVHAADEALYASKRGGRNRYTEGGDAGGESGTPSPGEA
jgi:diguanylate cyclase (GGDEF)-like protein